MTVGQVKKPWYCTVSQQPPPDRFMLQRQLAVDYPPDPGRLAVTDGYSKKGGIPVGDGHLRSPILAKSPRQKGISDPISNNPRIYRGGGQENRCNAAHLS